MAKNSLVPVDHIARAIYVIRGHKLMLDVDLAALYGVSPKALNQAVKRNVARFPDDFMFQLTWEEAENLRSQSVTLNDSDFVGGKRSRSQSVTLKRGTNVKYRPYAFTEQGVAMLSSVLHSERAVQVNIQIMRTFVQLRSMFASSAELRAKLTQLERKYDHPFKVVFDAIRQLMEPPVKPKRGSGSVKDDQLAVTPSAGGVHRSSEGRTDDRR
jgi:hypothetical protein